MIDKIRELAQHPRLLLTAIFIAAVVVRIIFTAVITGFQLDASLLHGDPRGFFLLAKNIVEGKDYGADAGVWGKMRRTPGYPIFIASLYTLLGNSLVTVQLFQALLGGLVCVLIYFVAKEIFDPQVGFLSAIYFALYPPHLYMIGQILSENLLLPLLLVSVIAFVQFMQMPTLVRAAACGIALGTATLIRPESGGNVLGIVLLTLALLRIEWNRRIPLAGVLMLSMVLVVSPWLIRNYMLSGRLVLSTLGGETFWGANNEVTLNDPKWRGHWWSTHVLPEAQLVSSEENELKRDSMRWRFGIAFVMTHKSDIPRLTYYKLKRFYSVMLEDRAERIAMIISFGLLLPFIAIGFFVNMLHFVRQRHVGLVLIVIVVYYNLLAVVFWGSNRFRLAIDPFLVMFGIWAVLHTLAYLARTFRRYASKPDRHLSCA